MTARAACLFLVVCCISGAAAGAPEKSGEVSLSSLAVNGPRTQVVTVQDPNEQTLKAAEGKLAPTIKTSYKAYEGLKAMDHLFKGRKNWSLAKTLKFTCADGYQPSLPVADFKSGGFYFAVARSDGGEFQIANQIKDGKKESLAPVYLIWTDPAKQVMANAYFWPYQLTSVKAER